MPFQSTPPSREATIKRGAVRATQINFNPRLPRGRRHPAKAAEEGVEVISIHASLAGGDFIRRLISCRRCNFNPRLLRGRRRLLKAVFLQHAGFQSTPPSREATRGGGHAARHERDFNPRLPRGRRPFVERERRLCVLFQSTPPSREATTEEQALRGFSIISIHASLAGGDCSVFSVRRQRPLISIHASLAGGDWRSGPSGTLSGGFQSTPPSREATEAVRRSDEVLRHFNPRLPRGRRRSSRPSKRVSARFQSTPPSREATARYSLVLPLEHNIWKFLRICREGCCFSLTFVAEKRRISTCFGANRPGKWAQLPLRTTGNFAYDLLLGR